MKEVKSIRCDECEKGYKWFREQKDYIEHCRVKHPATYEKIKIQRLSA